MAGAARTATSLSPSRSATAAQPTCCASWPTPTPPPTSSCACKSSQDERARYLAGGHYLSGEDAYTGNLDGGIEDDAGLGDPSSEFDAPDARDERVYADEDGDAAEEATATTRALARPSGRRHSPCWMPAKATGSGANAPGWPSGVVGELGRDVEGANIRLGANPPCGAPLSATVATSALAAASTAPAALRLNPCWPSSAYRWFSPAGGTVLDPFAGGVARGAVAAATGRRYVGVELRAEQVEANRAQWVGRIRRRFVDSGSGDRNATNRARCSNGCDASIV